MRLRSRKLYVALIASVGILIAGSTILLTQAQPYVPVKQSTPSITPSKPLRAIGIPTKLSIPAININANIKPLGLTASGNMEAPQAPLDAGWYRLGPRPGSIGSAVIAGHYGASNSNIQSVFDNLEALKTGDKISILDDAGETIVFVVQTTRILHRDDDTTGVFTSNDSKAHLNLITCHGTWEQNEQTYSDRYVVYTDVVPQ
jgi:sortase A